ncbi:helix-turn-helix transcriptional regulator [Mucilaginibacter sp. CSA2-8R]|uniref:helix-turn-helix domain-containing protein n=1 Tax=Mucilaginibacter sp. CSA2-8R TaxID=3141542 RepID=UPI00315DB150
MKRFKTISEFLQFRQMPGPDHPLLHVFKLEDVSSPVLLELDAWVYDFYCIGLKRVVNDREIKLKYGQQTYDYNNGILSFVAPNQVMRLTIDQKAAKLIQSGWMLMVHPDFLHHTLLAQAIREYDFWDYTVHEALFLSDREEATLVGILQNIQQECRGNIDQFSKSITISHLETLLNYADRFYHRQFLTRDKTSHEVLGRLEQWLNQYFSQEDLINKGLPGVNDVASALNLSPKYLSSLLKVLTGQNTQQHIHQKLIEKAKEQLSVTNLTVSEIAYNLGFEHLQSFSKLFKAKTNLSPLEFKASFN